jgi:hypothetical protein
LAEVLPTLSSWRPGSELVQEHAQLHNLFSSVEDPGVLLPQMVARALEHLGHRPDFSAKPNVPFVTRGQQGETLAIVVATAFCAPLTEHTEPLLQAMKRQRVDWGILTNGERWQLYHHQFSAPYEVEPLALMKAAFFSEPLRYFSLFFRAHSFAGFLQEALSGSAATEDACKQALLARALTAKQLLLENAQGVEHLARALFIVVAAANGWSPFVEGIQKIRANQIEEAEVLCGVPAPANTIQLDHRWLARVLQQLTPDDPSDPSGLRDARLRGVSWFAPLVYEAIEGRQANLSPLFASWVESNQKKSSHLFDLTPEAPLHISALMEAKLQPQRMSSLSPLAWQADLTRLVLWLSGARDESLLQRHKLGRLCIDSKEHLLAAVRKQASLFEAAAQSAIDRADVSRDRGWLTVLCDALAAQQDNIPAGFETLLSLMQAPAKLVAQPSVSLSYQWAKKNGVFHWWLSAPLEAGEIFFIASGLDAPIQRLLSLHPEVKIALRTSASALKRNNTAHLRRQVLQSSSLVSILSFPEQLEFVLVSQKGTSKEILFVSDSQRTLIPQENFLQHPGSPWTLLRQSKAISLAARIQARSIPMRELLLAAEPGQLFLSDDDVSLSAVAGFSPYQLRELGYAPGYLMACSLVASLRFVCRVDELSLLSLPIPRIRFQRTIEERESALLPLKPLLLAGRSEALLSVVAQQLAHGTEDTAHDLLAESAKTGHCIDTLPQAIISLLLGLSEEEATLIASVSPTPGLSFVAKPLPVHIPAVKVESEHREKLLAAFRQEKTLTSHQAQGATGLDSRRLRQLLTDLELAGEITRTGRGSGTLYHWKPT